MTDLRVQQFAAEPEAAYWARYCAWVPGTGYCCDRACSEVCVFRAQRDAERQRVVRWRRLRRIFIRR